MEPNPYFNIYQLDTDMSMVKFRGYGPDTVSPDAITVIKDVCGETEVLFNSGEKYEIGNHKSLILPPNTLYRLHSLGDAVVTISWRPAKPQPEA